MPRRYGGMRCRDIRVSPDPTPILGVLPSGAVRVPSARERTRSV